LNTTSLLFSFLISFAWNFCALLPIFGLPQKKIISWHQNCRSLKDLHYSVHFFNISFRVILVRALLQPPTLM